MASMYDGKWRRLRANVLVRDGFRCWACGAAATSVDHVVPVLEAPWLRLEPSNCRAACRLHNEGRVAGRLARMAYINRSSAKVREW